ncbi:hypothetical protein F511_28141 [Dorcoceras hygrometricum]|uniref:Uncharacterized protein n=1 Tax=Dorcoceras hygrometricum TaxID=472368 RepID=A0A2Z7B4F5_9LAMI|nr:hypothetical protein F511_28141 [Dorcoceras hygrometricum]
MAKSYFCLMILLLLPSYISSWIISPNECNPGCIRIIQWPSGYAGLHIPKYTVQITNEAWHSKGVYNVEIACPAFASTTLINPAIFRRIDLVHCVLKNGRIFNTGEVITFEYSNILPYPLAIVSMKCL